MRIRAPSHPQADVVGERYQSHAIHADSAGRWFTSTRAQRLSHARDTELPHLLECDMGHARQLVGVDEDVKNGRAGGSQPLAYGGFQLIGAPRDEALGAACAGEGGKVHVWEPSALESRKPGRLHFHMHQAPACVVEHHHLDRQLVLYS
jgi:hypothetical protein